MVYVLNWTISLNCATFFFFPHHGFQFQVRRKRKNISPRVWACESATSALKLKEGASCYPLAVPWTVHTPVLLSCPPTRIRQDAEKAWFHVTSRFIISWCGGWVWRWVCWRGGREDVGWGIFCLSQLSVVSRMSPVATAQTVTSVLLLVMKYGCGGG